MSIPQQYGDYSPSTISLMAHILLLWGKKKTLEKAFAKILRKKAGISREVLAFESDLDQTYIPLLDRGLRQPTLATILKM